MILFNRNKKTDKQNKIEATPLEKVVNIIIISTALLMMVVTLQPILNLLAISFSNPNEVTGMSGMAIIPKGFSFDIWLVLLKNPNVLQGLLNSLIITIGGTFLNVIATVFMAWPLAQKKLPYRRTILTFVLITMVFEPGIIPDFLLIKELGLMDSYWSVILYKAINAWYLIILIRFFEEVPSEIIDAAKIDGIGPIRTLIYVVMPLMKPAIATITLFYLVYHWNEYFRAMIYITSSEKWPLQVVLRQFVIEGDKVAMVGLTAASEYSESAQLSIRSLKAGMILLTIAPLLFVYPFILKFFTKGTMSGGVKG